MIAAPPRRDAINVEHREVAVEALARAGPLCHGLVGDAMLVVTDLDKGGADGVAPGTIEANLAFVTVGLTEAEDPVAHPLAGWCDVALGRGDADDLAAIAAVVAASPISSRALAMLLRGAEQRSLDDGLLAESAVYSTLQAGPEFAAWRAARPRRERGHEPEPVMIDRRGDVLDITLNRPHVRNALNTAMRDALVDAFELAAVDRSIAEVHLFGAGLSFCAGGDLDEFGSFPDPATAHLIRLGRSPARTIAAVADRVTAHLHDACVGSGIELPAFAATVMADPTTTIALPEVVLGLIPGAGGTVSLPRRIGRHRTAWLALTGKRIDASTARAWGLVDEIVEPRDR